MKKMKMYRLRRDVSITADDRPVHAVITPEDSTGLIRDRALPKMSSAFMAMPLHLLILKLTPLIAINMAWLKGLQNCPLKRHFRLKRALTLIGVSFEKGCYIGQEYCAHMRPCDTAICPSHCLQVFLHRKTSRLQAKLLVNC